MVCKLLINRMSHQPLLALRLLGGLALENPSGIRLGRAGQKRRLALLAILASPPGLAVSRERLIGLLWPEVRPEQARHRLAVALYDLRRAFGEGAIALTPLDVTLTPGAIGTDVEAFEGAVRSGAWERAAALYAGPFLDGVYLVGTSAFEHWVDTRRATLHRACMVALGHVAAGRAEAGDAVGAVEAWQRLAELDPYSGRFATGLMRALDAAGDRPGALRHAARHAALLRADLDAHPDAEVEFLAGALRRRTGPANGIDPDAAEPPAVDARRRRPAGPGPEGTNAAPVAPSPAGVPVREGADASTVFLPPVGAGPEGTDRPPVAPRPAGVGRPFRRASAVLVAIVLLAAGAAAGIRAVTRPPRAHAALERGLADMRAGRFDDAVDVLTRALDEESTAGRAAYALAVATFWADRPGSSMDGPLQEAQRRRASLAPLETLLLDGLVEWRQGRANRAEGLFRRALTIDSTSVEAWHQLGETLFHYNPARGRPIAEARAAFERAVALDPGHFGALWHLAQLAALDGRTAQATALCDRLLALRPDAARTLEVRFFRAAMLSDSAALARLLHELRDADESLLFGIGSRTAIFAGDLALAAHVLALLTAPDRAPYIQGLGHALLSYLDLARRDFDTAARRMREADHMLHDRGGILVLAALAGPPPGRAALDSVRAGMLRELDAASRPPGDGPFRMGLVRAGLAAVALLEGDTTASLSAANSLLRLAATADVDQTEAARRVRQRALTLHALHARASGRLGDAFAWLDLDTTEAPFGRALFNVDDARSFNRFLRARLLLEAGRTDAADAWLAGLASHVLPDLVLLEPVLTLRLEVALARGDSAAARVLADRLAGLGPRSTAPP
jgi:DNA-binding SARP family transcriptional activator/Tfp pilus assembly protein PilF